MPTLAEKAARFAALHQGPEILVLPNAWDPGTAIIMAQAGFPALATTSAGIAFAQGLPDGEAIGRDRMIALCGAIAAAVPVPVTADLEAGYGMRPEDVAATVRAAIAAGLAGCNIEDGTHDPARPLLDPVLSAERIQAGAEAARASGTAFVLNARADCYLARRGLGEANYDETIARAAAYRKAGAGSIFVPGVMDEPTITRLVAAIDAPLNILAARGGAESPLTVATLQRLGVRRVTIGGSLTLAALGLVRRAAEALRTEGSFAFARDGLTHVEANALMTR